MKAMLVGVATVGVVAGVEAQVFRAGTELVTVPVTVTPRAADREMPRLTAADFRIFEDGVARRLFGSTPGTLGTLGTLGT